MEGKIDIGLRNLGTVNKNLVTVSTPNGMARLYFSYSTLVAVDNAVSKNEWSKTTGKLLNELEPDKKRRIPHSMVMELAQDKLKRIL